jgi:hypothetical protein
MNTMQEILAAVSKGEISADEAGQLIANLGKKPKGVYLEVSEKGAVKIKGMRARWPIVLYPNEIQTLLGMSDKLIDFIEANKAKLSFHKGDLDEKNGDGGEVAPDEQKAA